MKIDFKKLIPHAIVLGILLLISIIYFYPAFQGYALKTHDLKMHKGMSKEIADFREIHNSEPLWTNSMFGGMPADQISVRYDSNLMSYVYDVLTLWMPRPVSMLWMMFLGFYILLMCLKVDPWIALIGAIGFGFSSFFLISMQAGHMSKVNAISFMAPMVGGFVLLFRGAYLKGATLALLFLSLQLWSNHPQITYYTFFVVGFVGLYFVSRLILEQKWMPLLKSGLLSFGIVFLGLLTNFASLWGTYEYGKHTIRGKSELTLTKPGDSDTTQTIRSGLDSDYILAWSYGTGETFTFLYPSLKGGGNNDPKLKSIQTLFPSSTEKMKEELRSVLDRLQIDEVVGQFGISLENLPDQERGYYGSQGGTNGPVFIGAILCFLALLALLYSDGKLNWVLFGLTLIALVLAKYQLTTFLLVVLLAMVVVSAINKRMIWFLFTIMVVTIMLGWGKNYLGFSEWFIHNFPLYNKFRSVTMILVVAEFLVPVMACLFLYELLKNKDKIKSNLIPLYIGGGLLGGLCLVVAMNPEALFYVPEELSPLGGMYKEGYFPQIFDHLMQVHKEDPAKYKDFSSIFPESDLFFTKYAERLHDLRVGIIRSDALLALVYIAGVVLLILGFVKEKISKPIFIGVLSCLVLLELIPVDLKYLNNKKDEAGDFNYWEELGVEAEPFTVFGGDLAILENEINQKPWIQDSINARVKKLNLTNELPLTPSQRNMVAFTVLNENTDFRVANFKGLASESRTSYFYKSLGGYHGAKLHRIQDIFDFGSVLDMQGILNMMNVKYLLEYEQSQETGEDVDVKPSPNPNALGNAWIVDQVKFVENADEELMSLTAAQGFDPANVAIVDKTFQEIVGGVQQRDPLATVEMLSYQPNELHYSFNSSSDQIVVFSEIFYDLGWQAYIDDQPVDHFRANYVLRGLNVPSGSHEITFKYSLKSFEVGNTISFVSSLAVILIVLAVLYLSFFRKDKETSSTQKETESVVEL